MDVVYPTGVSPKVQPDGSTLYRVRATNGTTYATKNCLMASLCDRAAKLGRAVAMSSAPGWYYREMTHVALVEETEMHP
jgi:hypothetical protein